MGIVPHSEQGKSTPPVARSGCTYRNETLHGDKRSLEVRPYTDTGDDLINDDLCPRRMRSKVDEQSSTKGHHEHAEPNDGAVLACFPDCNARHDGEDGQSNSGRKQVYTGEDRRSTEDGLKVQRQEVVAWDEDEGVTEASTEGSYVGALREDAQGHKRVGCKSRLNHEEQANDDRTKDDQTKHDW